MKTKTIFDRFVFFEKDRIHLKLVDVLIISRQQDCPLKFNLMNRENSTDAQDYKTSNLKYPLKLVKDSFSFAFQVEALEAVHLLEDWIWEHAAFLPLHDHAVFITK